MKLQQPKNPSYAAQVIKVGQLVELANCDNIVGLSWGGMQAIVGKDTVVGELGVIFPTECVLADEFLRFNNLYRHGERNNDSTKTGFIEDSRRVKALKFRGHQSDCFFMPIRSLGYLVAANQLAEGDVFDEVDGHVVCEKYEKPVRRIRTPREVVMEKRVDKRLFPTQEHISHFLREIRYLDLSARVVVTQKLHGTNLRVANTLVKRQQYSWKEKLAQRFGVQLADTEYATVVGSHLVVKGVDNPGATHYYGEDLWQTYGEAIAPLVPKGYLLYAEIVGFTSTGAQIQKGYTYSAKPRSADVYVYRVATVNPQGIVCDLSWPALVEFCNDRGLRHVPLLWEGEVQEVAGFLAEHLDTKFAEQEQWKGVAVPLSADSPCDEGVVVRIEGFHPHLLKAKSARFLQHESASIDSGAVDIEAEESVEGGE